MNIYFNFQKKITVKNNENIFSEYSFQAFDFFQT